MPQQLCPALLYVVNESIIDYEIILLLPLKYGNYDVIKIDFARWNAQSSTLSSAGYRNVWKSSQLDSITID